MKHALDKANEAVLALAKQQLRTARGRQFGPLYKRVRAEVTPLLIEDARAIIAETGALTPADVVRMAFAHDIIVKYAFEWLEGSVLPTGTYAAVRSRGFSPEKVARELGLQSDGHPGYPRR